MPAPPDATPANARRRNETLTVTDGHIAQLVDRIAAADAATAVVKEHADLARTALTDRIDPGVTVNTPAGRAVMSNPNPNPRIADPDAYVEWLAANRPTETIETPHIDGDAITRAMSVLDPDNPNDLPAIEAFIAALAALGCPHAIGTRTVASEKSLDRLAKDCDLTETDNGWIMVERETGEVVDGVTATRNPPALTVTRDKTRVAEWADQYRTRGTFALTEGE